MKLKIITDWYNEEDMAPYFLNHYSYVDTICIQIDSATNDKTVEVCSKYPNVEIKYINYPDGFDDIVRAKRISDESNSSKEYDWIFAVDADELIFASDHEDLKTFLSRQTGNVVWVDEVTVYKHVTEEQLDPTKPTLFQRRHGCRLGPKSNVIKPNFNVVFGAGQHSVSNKPTDSQMKASKYSSRSIFYRPTHNFKNDIVYCQERLRCSHWNMVDTDWAIKRLMNRNKMSKNRQIQGVGTHYLSMSAKSLTDECDQHKNDPQIL